MSAFRRSHVLELVPFGLVVLALWGKAVWFHLSLRHVWWAPEEPLAQWVRAHPEALPATLGGFLVLLGGLFLLPRIPRYVAIVAANGAFTLVILAQVLHVQHWGDVISVWSYSTPATLAAAVPGALYRLGPREALVLVDVVVGALLFLPYRRMVRREGRSFDGHTRTRVAAAAVALGLLLLAPAARLLFATDDARHAVVNLQRISAATVGLPLYQAMDVGSFLLAGAGSLDVAERDWAIRHAACHARRARGDSPLFGAGEGRNLILISAESLQSFVVGLEVQGRPVAPNLTALAAESLHFTGIYDQSHLGTTSDGELAANQSLHPLPSGTVAGRHASNRFHGLPAVLRARGYGTFSAVGAPGSFWRMADLHASYGYERSYFLDDFETDELLHGWLADRSFFRQSVLRLESAREPFMAFLMSSSNHYPFLPTGADPGLRLGELEGTLVGRYLQSVHHFDRALGELVEALRGTGLLERSVIALYGDHRAFLAGEEELDRLLGLEGTGVFGRLRADRGVPFLVRLPQAAHAGARSGSGGQLDIVPTLLTLLGVPPEAPTVTLGTDLTREEDALVVFRDGSFVLGERYFVPRLRTTPLCFGADGGEVDCTDLEEAERTARLHLAASDLILRGDLVPEILQEMQDGPECPPEETATSARAGPAGHPFGPGA